MSTTYRCEVAAKLPRKKACRALYSDRLSARDAHRLHATLHATPRGRWLAPSAANFSSSERCMRSPGVAAVPVFRHTLEDLLESNQRHEQLWHFLSSETSSAHSELLHGSKQHCIM